MEDVSKCSRFIRPLLWCFHEGLVFPFDIARSTLCVGMQPEAVQYRPSSKYRPSLQHYFHYYLAAQGSSDGGIPSLLIRCAVLYLSA